MRSTRRTHLMLAAGLAALALTAAPAWAGNGNGHGNGNGNANPHDNHGATASSLGGLNAAHASENAFAHASPNSRVGRIAAYREAALAAQTAADTEAAISDALAHDDFSGDGMVDATDGTYDFNGDGVVDSADATAEQAAVGALDTNADGVLNQDDVTNAQTTANTAQANADAALGDAANKPVDGGVVDAVNHLLGLD